MSEEKVSACVHKVNPETDRCVLCGKNRWNREPPAADAEPRIRHSDGIGGECPGCEDCNRCHNCDHLSFAHNPHGYGGCSIGIKCDDGETEMCPCNLDEAEASRLLGGE